MRNFGTGGREFYNERAVKAVRFIESFVNSLLQGR